MTACTPARRLRQRWAETFGRTVVWRPIAPDLDALPALPGGRPRQSGGQRIAGEGDPLAGRERGWRAPAQNGRLQRAYRHPGATGEEDLLRRIPLRTLADGRLTMAGSARHALGSAALSGVAEMDAARRLRAHLDRCGAGNDIPPAARQASWRWCWSPAMRPLDCALDVLHKLFIESGPCLH